MERWKRIIYYLFISIACILLFSGCGDKRLSQNPSNNANLDEWVGDYEFYEFAPPNINMQYSINIYKENGEYYAKINIDGFQTNRRIKAKVQSKKDSIDLVFDAYLLDSTGEDLNKGDVLLNFKKVNSKILTNWEKIQPMLLKNKVSGKVYFTKVKQ